MDYRERYLKYKNKYLNLQKYYVNLLKGGNVPNDDDKLIDCFIASSHNTYLQGNQLSGATNINCYFNFIKKYGGGCVEMDVLNVEKRNGNDDVRIGHTGTASGVLYLRDILIGIKGIIHTDKMLGPVILSFDNKDITKYEDHQKIWNMFTEVLGDDLYKNFGDNNLYIKDVKGKVLIKWPEDHECKCIGDDCSVCSGKHLFKPVNVNITTGEHWTHMNKSNTESTSSEYSLEKSLKDLELFNTHIKETKSKFIRTYPKAFNILSGNYPFMQNVIHGAQLVALNIQSQDVHTMFQMEFFRNGCLRKKPQWMFDNITNVPLKTYNITINEKFKDIQIYKDDSDKLVDAKSNKFNIDVVEGFELIYIKCSFNGKKYKGAITLTSPENKLYNIENYTSNTCNWFTNDELNKLNPIILKTTINGTNINIS
jgi:hypothetical protein